MTSHMKLDEKALREILDGCEGVTPGPWTMVDVAPGANVMVCDTEDTILSVHRRTRPKSFEVAIAAHIARLDPQTVASIVIELLELRTSHAPQGGVRGADAIVAIIEDNTVGGTDDFPVVNLAGIIGDLAALTGSDTQRTEPAPVHPFDPKYDNVVD